METLLIIIGLAVVAATVYFVIRRYDVRMVLFASGLLMALISLEPLAALEAFSDRMVSAGLLRAILTVMAFASVMKATQCDLHLIHLIVNGLKKVRPILVPAAALATFGINIALPSAAGTSAAVGAVFIPVLMAAGIHPAAAACSVFAGTFGSMLNPGLAHNPFVADLADVGVMEVIATHMPASIASGVIGAIALAFVVWLRKEDRGYAYDVETPEEFEVKILNAIVPVVPLAILVLGATEIIPALDVIDIPGAMIIGAILGLVVSRTDPAEVTKSWFDGMGNAFSNVMGIIIAAAVFVAGLETIGLVDALINLMLQFEAIVLLAGTFGPFLLAVISGSGDAAAFAFNEAITPEAAMFGLGIIDLGALAALAGALGRTMSPVAAAAIVCAGYANVNPIELTKRMWPGMIIAAVVSMLILGYM